MVLVRSDLLALAIILIAIGVFLIAVLVPYPLVYVGWVAFIAGIIILGYWIYKQASGGS